MHYYKFHISDWSLATNHLSLEEEAVYFRLLNYYYDTECPIPLETQTVSRRLRFGNHSETLELILNEFFEETDDGWINKRCDVEIEEYQKKVEHNKKVGKLGGRPKKNNDLQNNPEITQGVSTINPDITLTINHKPITNNTIGKTKSVFIKPSLDEVIEYFKQKETHIDPEKFYAYYESIGWMVGKNKMKDWKACLVTWEKNNNSSPVIQSQPKQKIYLE